MRTSTPCGIGVSIVVVIRAVLALNVTRVRVDSETGTEWRRRSFARIVVTVYRWWLM